MTLKTRNAIVTGSTSGIGLAIARALAKEGANIVINGMGDTAAIEAESNFPDEALPFRAEQRLREVVVAMRTKQR